MARPTRPPRSCRDLCRRDARIAVLDDGGGHAGAAGNFGRVMQQAYDRGADYLFLADQDDVWQADKLERLLAPAADRSAGPRAAWGLSRLIPRGCAGFCVNQGTLPFGPPLRVVARKSGQSPVPRLVYSDLVVVDGHLRTLQRSFLRYSRLRQASDEPLRTLLGRSFVLGCASGMNRALLELALPLPAGIASHDWWVALCAAAAGRSPIPPAHALVSPARTQRQWPGRFLAGWNPWRHAWGQRWERGYRSFRQSIEQALALRQRLDQRRVHLTEETRQCLDRFCACSTSRSRPGGEPSNSSVWTCRPLTCLGGSSITSASGPFP